MAEVEEGDTVVVASFDHIAYSTKHLLEIMESLNAAGVTFKAINNDIDTSTSHGKAMQAFLGTIVEFERKVLRETKTARIAKAKKEGRYKGRKPTARAKSDNVMALNEQGLTRQKIADELGISVASVYRILRTNAETQKPCKKMSKRSENALIDKQNRGMHKPTRNEEAEQLSFF